MHNADSASAGCIGAHKGGSGHPGGPGPNQKTSEGSFVPVCGPRYSELRDIIPVDRRTGTWHYLRLILFYEITKCKKRHAFHLLSKTHSAIKKTPIHPVGNRRPCTITSLSKNRPIIS